MDQKFWMEIHCDYINSELSIPDIAAKHSLTTVQVRWNFKKYGLKIKNRSRLYSEILKKTRKTTKEKYGDEVFTRTASYKEKSKDTCLEKYGTEYAAQSEDVKQKIVETNKLKYGVHPSSLEVTRSKIRSSLLKTFTPSFLEKVDGYKLLNEYKGVTERVVSDAGRSGFHRSYQIQHTCGEIFESTILRPPRCPKCFPYSESKLQYQYKEFLSQFTNVISNYRKVEHADGRTCEIDLFLPDFNIGFEINSLYYHAYYDGNRISRKYHVDKTETCLNNNIKLYHVWEHLDEKLVKSKILHILGQSKKLYGKRKVITPQREQVNSFFIKNHLHGTSGFTDARALVINNEIVAVLSVNKCQSGLEIARFAILNGYSVPGAFTQLFKAFGLKTAITYVDRDFTPARQNAVYAKNGFEYVGWSEHMFYTDFKTVYSRQTFQKHKLENKLSGYDDKLSAAANLLKHGIYPCFTSGNWKYIFTKP